MSKKIYIVFGLISALILIFFITLVTSDSSKENSNKISNDNESSSLEKKYSKNEIKMAKKRNEIEVNVDDKMQEYIIDTESPKNQEVYDKAIKMRDEDDQKHLKRDIKDLVDQKREVRDISTETSYINSKEIEGTYEYTLIYEKDGKTQSENKDGSYTLDTNKDGYFYIKTFE